MTADPAWSAEIPYWWRVATQIWVVPLVKFSSTNQKHYPDLSSDASSVWNFWARFSDVVSRGNRWSRGEMSAAFSLPRRRKSNRPFPSFPGLCFKTRVGAQPLIWKLFFILMQIKLLFTSKIVHLGSFWKRGFLELGSGLLSHKVFIMAWGLSNPRHLKAYSFSFSSCVGWYPMF